MSQVNQKVSLDATLINSVSSATLEVLSTMAATETTLKSVLPKEDYQATGDVSGVIGITGDDGQGMVAVSFPMNLATKVVARLLGVGPDTLTSEDRGDGIGELLNMISGKAKATLSASSAKPYVLSLPSIIMGKGHEIAGRPKGYPYLVLLFDCEGEEFNIQVSFKPNN